MLWSQGGYYKGASTKVKGLYISPHTYYLVEAEATMVLPMVWGRACLYIYIKLLAPVAIFERA